MAKNFPTSRSSVLTALAFALISAFHASADASTVATQAWSKTFNIGSSNQLAGPNMRCDASGYAYFTYVSEQPSSNVLHLVKIGPSKNVVFDGIVDNFNTPVEARGVAISPKINGKQYVYVMAHFIGPSGVQVYLHKVDTAFVKQWAAPFVQFAPTSGGTVTLLGAFANSAGHFYGALQQAGVLRLVDLDAAGGIANDHTVSYFGAQEASYNPANDTWNAAGTDLTSTHPHNGCYGIFDPQTGVKSFGQSLNGRIDPDGYFVEVTFHMCVMHSGNLAVIENNYFGHNGVRETASYYVYILLPNGTTNSWYDSSSNGMISQLDQFSEGGTVYGVGRDNLNDAKPFLNTYDAQAPPIGSGATLIEHRLNQPVDVLFPTFEGFYSSWYQASTNTVFLEHFDSVSAAFDFGKGYKGTGVGQSALTGIAFFQNFFYVGFNLAGSASGWDVTLDRYVTGVCMQTISCPSTVAHGGLLPVTISLNGLAPTGGIVFGLNSSTNHLLMPNGTRAQTFTISAGASKLVIYLETDFFTSTGSATLLAIQNGIRRGAATTITP